MALGSELKDVKPSCSNVKPGSCRLSRVSKPRAPWLDRFCFTRETDGRSTISIDFSFQRQHRKD